MVKTISLGHMPPRTLQYYVYIFQEETFYCLLVCMIRRNINIFYTNTIYYLPLALQMNIDYLY